MIDFQRISNGREFRVNLGVHFASVGIIPFHVATDSNSMDVTDYLFRSELDKFIMCEAGLWEYGQDESLLAELVTMLTEHCLNVLAEYREVWKDGLALLDLLQPNDFINEPRIDEDSGFNFPYLAKISPWITDWFAALYAMIKITGHHHLWEQQRQFIAVGLDVIERNAWGKQEADILLALRNQRTQ